MTGHHEPAQAEAVLNHLILQLDEQLSKNNTPFLLGTNATSVDFSIWSFLAQDRTTLKLAKVHDWFNRVAAEPCIKVTLHNCYFRTDNSRDFCCLCMQIGDEFESE